MVNVRIATRDRTAVVVQRRGNRPKPSCECFGASGGIHSAGIHCLVKSFTCGPQHSEVEGNRLPFKSAIAAVSFCGFAGSSSGNCRPTRCSSHHR